MNAIAETKTAPIKATWICLGIAWLLFLIPVPGLGMFVGWPLNLVAFILAIVVMTRGKTAGGLIPLLASIVVSPIIYFIGLAIFGAALSAGDAYGDYKERVEATNAVAESTEAVASETADQALSVSAIELFNAYDANEVAADRLYKGKLMRITATVAGINKDFTDSVYVELETPNEFSSAHARGIDPDAAAALQKGQKVTVECKGAGLMVGSPLLDDCRLL
jgi:hypothetical protein